METAIYYVLCAMTLGGALGVILARGYVNAAMSMLLSMLGAAGMMVMMGAYFVAFIMVSVYAGAVLVLFVFVVMLMGEEKDGAGLGKKLALVGLWALLGAFIGWASPEFLGDAALRAEAPAEASSALASAKNYGLALFSEYMLPFQICGALRLAAMLGVIAVAKPPRGGGGQSEKI